MTSKFEQLIEYVINDEEAKAKELFHDIVVEKSREIYENLMDEAEELDEESDAERDDHAEKAGKKVAKDIEYDEMHEDMGGDASDDLINDVEAEEQGMQEADESDVEFDDAAEDDGEELTHDMEKDHDEGADIEDRVVDLEDKLDELMAEFESLMGDNMDSDSVSDMDGGDALEMDDTDTAEFSNEEMGMMEAVSLAKAPAPVTSEPAGTNTKSTNANNSGAKGAVASPVKMTGDTAQGRPAPTTGELIGKVQNSIGGDKKLSAAPKPVTAQASGVNTKTPFPKA
jgi:tetrahydromethanopterin S-methyltransferase subunit G